MFKTSALRAAGLTAVVCLIQIAHGGSESGDDRFHQIRKTIEANCSDCYGASKADFVQAVQALGGLIAGGYTDPEAAKLLADSYRVWALVYSDSENSPAAKDLLRKEQVIYTKLVRQNPTDAKLWLAYARTLREPPDRLQALKRAESLAPEDAAVHYALGMLYAHGLGDSKKGVAYLERAVELEPGYAKVQYGDQLARTLESIGEPQRAAQVRTDMRSFEQDLEARDRLKHAEK